MNAGNASDMSSRFIDGMDDIIYTPTRTRHPDVAARGIRRKNGERNNATRNSSPVTADDMPVRPPAAAPEVLSAMTDTADNPKMLPTNEPIEHAAKARSGV